MAKVIARIRLAHGETGYYDEKSGIFLNWSHPEADVMEGTDCSGLRVSSRCRRIKVLSGSLGKSKSFKQILAEAKAKRLGVPVEHILHEGKKLPVYVETVETASTPVTEDSTVKAESAKTEEPTIEEEAKVEEPVVEDPKEEATVEEAAAEASVEEPAVEEKPKKTTRRRRTTKKTDAKAEDKAEADK